MTDDLATTIARWTIAAFTDNPSAEHDKLVELLRANRVPHAYHAVAIVPIAFGRQILEGLVTVPDFYERDGRQIRYADDPIYVAARDEARHASREQLQAIGLVGAEVNAVNAALHGGGKPDDLVLTPVLVHSEDEPAGELPDPAPLLAELVRRHGATLPLEARVYPNRLMTDRAQLQLDVAVRVGEREILESFAGVGATIEGALVNAIDKLARGSLHVLLASLVDRNLGGQQVEWETWRGREVCLGPLLLLWGTSPPLEYAALLNAIRGALPPLSPDVHWFRLFVAIDDGVVVAHDALLDNQPVPAVSELIAGWPWPKSERPYALRHFVMIAPADRRA